MSYTVEQAIKSMKHSMITAFWKTNKYTGLTIDKCSELQDALIEELFHPSVIWAVKTYLGSKQTIRDEKDEVS